MYCLRTFILDNKVSSRSYILLRFVIDHSIIIYDSNIFKFIIKVIPKVQKYPYSPEVYVLAYS